ncbi:MAG: hypothetical protein JG774_1361 [Desulfomicrobiaceae bacterium]|jgi:hypothetical protein|nr:hypothetical protein [Desulfomicrobiaceae bacterium]MBC7356820.1 hypothetical protein [Desulfomicrobiaceae bacterium]MBZ4685616.1 hypothetical protein [Desulfomicrobiaceae bacterium]
MPTLSATRVQVQPQLDPETYLLLSQRNFLDAKALMELTAAWERWMPAAHTWRIGGRKGYLLVFLDAAVEEEIDPLWENAPAQAFAREAMAQALVLGYLTALRPGVRRKGCAPVPTPTPALVQAIAPLGIELHESGALSRKYATLTYASGALGCESCHVEAGCPKRLGLQINP